VATPTTKTYPPHSADPEVRRAAMRPVISPRVWRALSARVDMWLHGGYATSTQVSELRARLDAWEAGRR
jgi:hypothetical protein